MDWADSLYQDHIEKRYMKMAQDEIKECPLCGNKFPKSEMHKWKGRYVCPDCWTYGQAFCHGCGEDFEKKELTKVDDEWLCPGCLEYRKWREGK